MDTVQETLKRNRPKSLSLVRVSLRGKPSWKLKGYYIDGARVRKFFSKKIEGEKFIQDLKDAKESLGVRAFEVTGWLHEQAIKANELLAPYNATLLEAAQAFVRAQEEQKGSVPVPELIKRYQDSRKAKGMSLYHLKDIKSRTGRFEESFSDRLASDVTTRQIDEWISGLGLSPVSFNNYRAVLHGVFAFAKKQGYTLTNPVSDVEKVKVVSKPPGILTVNELRVLLKAAEPDVQCVIAVAAFAGLRHAELERLKWKDINFDEGVIDLSAGITKTAQRRLVSISDNLALWLERYSGAEGGLVPVNYRKRFLKAAEVAGFRNPMALPGNSAAQSRLKPWPHNALRHSYASYHLAKWQDASKTALQLGHATTDILFQHYRELVKPADAEKYWGLMPENVASR